MTAFANAQGAGGAFNWAWELRSVNGKGLDVRLRVPDWILGLEQDLKTALGEAMDRGNVALSLKVSREDSTGRMAVNADALEDALNAFETVEAAALAKGISLAPATAADVLAVRGVMETSVADDDISGLRDTLIEDFKDLVKAFVVMRASEGKKLSQVLAGQINEIDRLIAEAASVIVARRNDMEAGFKAALARIDDGTVTMDAGRVAQEMAVLAVKADVTEEIDRLSAHVAAARELIANGSPVGRKLDFLAQEFNREANTLCSKSQHTELTNIGLALKTTIDQMREQVQNVE
ncbi:MAG: YicC/YloC family endoribonuclease [Pseudomonadota bacterium]